MAGRGAPNSFDKCLLGGIFDHELRGSCSYRPGFDGLIVVHRHGHDPRSGSVSCDEPRGLESRQHREARDP